MRKIPTLFERVFENHRKVDIRANVTQGMEWVLEGTGMAQLSWKMCQGALRELENI